MRPRFGAVAKVLSCAYQTTNTIMPGGTELLLHSATNMSAADRNCPKLKTGSRPSRRHTSRAQIVLARTKRVIRLRSGKRDVMLLLLLFSAPAAVVKEHITTSGRTTSQSPQCPCVLRPPSTGTRHRSTRRIRLSGAGIPTRQLRLGVR